MSADTRRVLGSDAARAVGRFRPEGPLGYRAATMPDAPLRETRAEAVEDERAWRDLPERAASTTIEPFCACGRVISECDGSRRGCRKGSTR